MKPTLLDKKTSPEEIKNFYIHQKWSLRMVARHFKVNRNTIKRYLEKHDITQRTERLLLLDKITHPEEIYKLYWKDNLSLTEIANNVLLPICQSYF